MMPSGDDVGPPKPPPATFAPRWAIATFVALFLMNLLDYTDRWILAAVVQDVQAELTIDNARAGMFNTYFLISYAVFAPFMGWAGDRLRRTWLLAAGVGVWSLATVGTGLAQTYWQIVAARALLGLGEATYGVIAPTILMDLFSRQSRARVLSAFYLAMPIGGALGFILGATIAERSAAWVAGTPLEPYGGWRLAFFLVGAPGVLAALVALVLPEPIRGSSEGLDPERLRKHERTGASRADYVDLMVNSSYTYAVFGMAAFTFAIGGLAFWLPKFLTLTKGLDREGAIFTLGLVTLGASVLGMSLGGWLADRLAWINPRALFLVPGTAMLLAIPFALVGLLSRTPIYIFTGIFLAELLMFMNTGPCNAVIAHVVQPNLRAAAYAIALFAVHFLGDIWSPPLMGLVADLFGDPDTMATSFGQAFAALGAVPTLSEEGHPQNLLAGMLVVIPALAISGLVLLAGARHLPREMALMVAKLQATSRLGPRPSAPPGEPPAR